MLPPGKDPSVQIRETEPGASSPPLDLRARIAEQIERTEGFSVLEYEQEGVSPPLDRVENFARQCLGDARDTLSDVIRHYERSSQVNATHGSSHLLDLVALGRMELNVFLDRVARGGGVRWERIALCDSAVRNVRRCLRAVDDAIARREGLELRRDESEIDLKTALTIRKAYLRFYRDVAGDVLPDSGTIRVRLRAAAAGIAILLGSDISPSIRVHDRFMFREFRARIRSALQDPLSPGVLDANIKLWEDLLNFSTLLLDISKREELRQHDRQLIAALLPTLEAMELSGAPRGRVSPKLMGSLMQLEGRDRELDEYIRTNGDWNDLLRILRRVARSLVNLSDTVLNHTNSGSWQGIV